IDLTKIELARVEQVFDARTVPLKRIDALVLGFTDSRATSEGNTPQTLKLPNPPFSYKEDVDPSAGQPKDPNAPAPGATPAGAPPVGVRPAVIPLPGTGTALGPKKTDYGGGSLLAVADGNKKRYIEVKEQFRRIPVGIVVIIDQTQIQDML